MEDGSVLSLIDAIHDSAKRDTLKTKTYVEKIYNERTGTSKEVKHYYVCIDSKNYDLNKTAYDFAEHVKTKIIETRPTQELMDDFYNNVVGEDAVNNMSNDEGVELSIIGVLNPLLTDNTPKASYNALVSELKGVSDKKLRELQADYDSRN